jgi:NAD+ kinase
MSSSEPLIRRIGLVFRRGSVAATELGCEFCKWSLARGYQILIEEHSFSMLPEELKSRVGIEPVQAEVVAHRANPIVSLGGDGTLIGVARYVGVESPALIGVNFGNLGFLTEITPDELFEVVDSYFNSKVSFGIRYLLATTVVREGKPIFFSQAVNEIVVQKTVQSPLLPLDVFVNEEAVMRLKADGLIVATPTGSTAYSLAAGGAIAYPTLPVSLITPLCPHGLTHRPLILPLESTIEITVPKYTGTVILMVDGQVSINLQESDTVLVTQSDHLVKFVRSPSQTYFEILRKKLSWGLS